MRLIMRLSNQNLYLVIPELDKAQIRKTPDGKFSIYDLIQICTGVKNPYDSWNSLCSQYPEVLGKTEDFQFPGQGQRLTPVATFENCLYILGLLPGHCGKSYREKAANLVRRYLEGDAELGAEMIIRDHNLKRQERAKKRLLVCDTNKEIAEMVTNFGVNPGKIHNDRYKGLYGKIAEEMRKEAGIKSKETPLNVLSTRDLTLNSLVNQLALESNPNLTFDIAKGISSGIEKSMKKPLEPIYEKEKLQISKAKKQLDNDQLELPL
jgi:hypothetical protein